MQKTLDENLKEIYDYLKKEGYEPNEEVLKHFLNIIPRPVKQEPSTKEPLYKHVVVFDFYMGQIEHQFDQFKEAAAIPQAPFSNTLDFLIYSIERTIKYIQYTGSIYFASNASDDLEKLSDLLSHTLFDHYKEVFKNITSFLSTPDHIKDDQTMIDAFVVVESMVAEIYNHIKPHDLVSPLADKQKNGIAIPGIINCLSSLKGLSQDLIF